MSLFYFAKDIIPYLFCAIIEKNLLLEFLERSGVHAQGSCRNRYAE